MITTKFTPDSVLSEFMAWAFDNLDSQQVYTIGFNFEGFIIIKEGGETYIKDFAPTLQCSTTPLKL